MMFITVLNALRQHLYFNLINWALSLPGACAYPGNGEIVWEDWANARHVLAYSEPRFYRYFANYIGGWKALEIDWTGYLGEMKL